MTEHDEITEVPATHRHWLDRIGAFRLEVWRGETQVNEELFPSGRWIEDLDYVARHWVALDSSERICAAARLTVHSTVQENPDGYLWLRAGRPLPVPAAHLCKLVVRKDRRGSGLGSRLNEIRIEAAIAAKARSIIVTASDGNTRLLQRAGFVDTGIRETFPNRPGFEFRALELIL